ncbi:hypothetical protein R3P38DRAFT_2806020 [Favolaschia claudopus]|uniref:Uncharacterized protein n=1 Tax=Favolaschia claudopus TaxID=2862362 RepID=A0AAV9ZL47_9AGAR
MALVCKELPASTARGLSISFPRLKGLCYIEECQRFLEFGGSGPRTESLPSTILCCAIFSTSVDIFKCQRYNVDQEHSLKGIQLSTLTQKLAYTAIKQKRKTDPRPATTNNHNWLRSILGCGLASFRQSRGKILEGTTRFFRILISESAFMIWKIRNECVIQHQGSPLAEAAIRNKWLHQINQRLLFDCTLTNIAKYDAPVLVGIEPGSQEEEIPPRRDRARAAVRRHPINASRPRRGVYHIASLHPLLPLPSIINRHIPHPQIPPLPPHPLDKDEPSSTPYTSVVRLLVGLAAHPEPTRGRIEENDEIGASGEGVQDELSEEHRRRR